MDQIQTDQIQTDQIQMDQIQMDQIQMDQIQKNDILYIDGGGVHLRPPDGFFEKRGITA